MAIRNNVGGYEKSILQRYKEPTWNNPIVRFVDEDGLDVIPRKSGVWSTSALLGRMTAALKAADRPVPKWLETVALETGTGDVQTAVFAMT